jgi:hypothetical protein
MKLAIADPPYLGRAVRWYGENGCGDGHGKNQADNHPEAYLWDLPETHRQLVRDLEQNYDGWAIAMTVHSLSTYLQEVETDSRNGIRVGVWHKPSAYPSGSRIGNYWEPVLFRIPQSRKGRALGKAVKDVLTVPPLRSNFVGAKPKEWTEWVLQMLGYEQTDEVHDLFAGSNAVTNAISALNGKID